MALVATSTSLELTTHRLIQITLLWLYICTLLYLLLAETNFKASWALIPSVAAIPIGLQSYLIIQEQRFLEQITVSVFVIAGDATIGMIATYLARTRTEKGFYLVAASGFLVAIANAIKLHELLLISGNFNLTDFSWKTNFLIIAHLVGIMFINIGYAGVLLERTAKQKAIATAQRIQAEAENQKIAALLKERDQMVMINSQFATISGMSLLTGAIIHEITQPIQALVMAIDKAKSEAHPSPELRESFRFIDEQAANCVSIVTSLRMIMSKGNTETKLVDLAIITKDILPVIKSECERRKIGFLSNINTMPLLCHVSPVLFRRIIFNLASNAIDALTSSDLQQATLCIALRAHNHKAILEVIDNSGQRIEIEKINFETLAASEKPSGMGLGLMLCAKIADVWHGRLSVKSDDALRKTVFTLELPLEISGVTCR